MKIKLIIFDRSDNDFAIITINLLNRSLCSYTKISCSRGKEGKFTNECWQWRKTVNDRHDKRTKSDEREREKKE